MVQQEARSGWLAIRVDRAAASNNFDGQENIYDLRPVLLYTGSQAGYEKNKNEDMHHRWHYY